MKKLLFRRFGKVPACAALFLSVCCFFSVCDTAEAATYPVNQRLTWKGVNWGVFPSNGSACSTNNAWLDDAGQLHLRLQKNGSTWCGISLENPTTALYGKMIWKASSNSLDFETGTTWGVFTYTDDYHELDIELNKWPGYDWNAWFSNQPADIDGHPEHIHYGVPSDSPYYHATNLTYIIDWQPTYVDYFIMASDGSTVLKWRYTNASDIPAVAATLMVDMLAMSYGGPVSGNSQEIVLSDYQYIPSVASPILTVTNGSGSGSYTVNRQVTVTANTAAGQVFDKWTGNTEYISDIYSPTATFAMPASPVSLIATYKSSPTPSAYTLTVTDGTGSGSYASNTKVTISANTPATGKVFDKWTGSTAYIASATSATTTVTMPSSAITLTATYKDSPAATYALTVNQGTGSGSYVSGKAVTISANLPTSSSKAFDKWTGDTAYLSNITSATTTVTMPNKAITLTATYKDVITTYYLTVNSGSGDGNYAPNTKVTVTAAPAVTGMVFEKWTGDIDYLSLINSSTAIVTMPAKAINITAYYVPVTAPETTYSLLVNFGSGDGKYTQGAKVTITADAPTAGKVFDKWTGDIAYLSSTTSATTTVTMPNKSITLNATYKTISITKYILTVNQGTGDGSYAAGTQATIKADAPATNQVFDKWTGDTDYISSVTASSATVTMPAKATTLTATYKSKDSSLPDGTLIKTPDSNKVYVIIAGEKKWLSTPEVFEQMGYAWSSIKIIATMDMANYTDFEDNLIRAIGEIQVYLVINGTKRHIPNPQVFLSYGFSWNDIKEVTKEAKMRYKDAYLIRESGREEVYYLNPAGVRKHIPSQAVFDSYQNSWSDVQIVSSDEMNAHPVSNLIQLEGSYDVYAIANSTKKLIPDVQTFNRNGYIWDRVIKVNKTEFDYYQYGGIVK